MDSVQHHTHLASSSFPSFSSHSTNSTPSYPVYHSTATNNVPYMQQQQQQPSPRLQHAAPAPTNIYHSPSLHHHQQPMHTAPHYSPKFNSGAAMPTTHFSLDEASNNNSSSIPNSPQISPSVRTSQNPTAALRSPKFKSSPLLSPSTGPIDEKGDERQRCCVVCLRNSPKTIFSCRYKVHDKNVDVLNKYFDRDLKFGELCDRCYRLWYKFKRNAGSTNTTPSFSPMIPPNGTPPFSPLTSPASPKAMRQNSSQKNLSLSPLVLQQANHNGVNIGNSPLSLVPSSPASSSSKPYPAQMMPPPFSLAGSGELTRDEKDIVHHVVNQHYQHYSPNKKFYMDGMEHYLSQPIPAEKVTPSSEDNVEPRLVHQSNHSAPVIEEEEELATVASSNSSTQDDMETSSSSSSSSSRTTSPSPKPRSFINQLMELSKPPRISKRKPTAIRSVAKVDPVTEFVKFGHYTSTHSTSSIPLQTLYKNVARTFNV